MKRNTALTTFIGIAASLTMLVPSVSADMCTTQYGGTTTCQPSDLTINKQVYNPVAKTYVDNLTTTDPTFTPGNEVIYRLIVHNGSGETFQAEVKDILPPYLTFVSGPGSYDAGLNKLTFKMENLIAGETRTQDIVAKVVDVSKFPSGKSLFCVVNVGEVRALNRFDSDSAQVCLQNGTVTVTKLPVAGFNDMMLLLPFAGVGLGGFALLKGKKRG